LPDPTFSLEPTTVFQTVAFGEFDRKIARFYDERPTDFGLTRQKGREMEARGWRALCVVAVLQRVEVRVRMITVAGSEPDDVGT